MSRSISGFSLALIATIASTVLASAQVTSSLTDTSSQAASSPVAYVYVSSVTSSGKSQIDAYAAASNGSLTSVPGSPFRDNVNYLALNGAWLFAVDNTFVNINSYSIAANGSLTFKDTYNVSSPGPGVISLYLDHSGATLYADYYTTNNDYLSFSIDQSTGQLKKVGDLPGGPANNSPVSFIGNNEFAYSSSCYHFGPAIYGVKRASDGSLSYLNINPPFPTPPSGDYWCPWRAAADPTNHLAIALQPFHDFNQTGPYQLATYTADSSGNLSTTSTYSNMPKVLVGSVTDYWMSPDGKFLAVGGSSGLQIFHFNGAKPITKYTGLLTTNQIDQMFWDNANHLYAVSQKAGKLYVFTVTSTSVTQAPGSPHSITSPQNIIVLPKT
jgi:6-phosphogluconolactonase (cycloisomerase 2 family)